MSGPIDRPAPRSRWLDWQAPISAAPAGPAPAKPSKPPNQGFAGFAGADLAHSSEIGAVPSAATPAVGESESDRGTVEFVTLRGGLVLPVPALKLVLDFERRDFQMGLDACEQFVIEPTAALTDVDRVGIHRWRLHLAAIVRYECPELPQ